MCGGGWSNGPGCRVPTNPIDLQVTQQTHKKTMVTLRSSATATEDLGEADGAKIGSRGSKMLMVGSRGFKEPPTVVQKEISVVLMVNPMLDLNVFSPGQ